ncbi:NADPH oxidase regulator NoxR [Cryphonectria parasitica EP155]|uniref:NADPH oxidase regulator NoxR n=1 Tax=Cryphonectria parasitica (strain ATCC 38755 / EP155) TaxID=660469 RepID=A0A9P5CUB3_CRYP1|nr:NADPH oxidase regulator NoxR [Cryphonectria parasitica EP155]KAF3770286.1 NADPH oxidase regulator NoxR [Cryphonectria parasitica EP155]
MSLKQEIETWVTALARYDNNEFDEALGDFEKIADTSKILFNMGVIHATLGEHEKAVDCYQRAIKLDQYLAVAYFQQGVSNFLLGDFEEALANFNDTLLYLRGNTMIDYAQLGLLFKLYSCEVLFNRGLCYLYLQQKDAGLQDLSYAVKEKVVEDHNVIDEAIKEEAEGYTVFSIPVGVVYRPNEAKVRNLKTKDYLGKARLVAASDRANAFTGFAGSEIKNAGKVEVKDDRPADNISFAATNLVKPGLASRSNATAPPPPGPQGSNVFPPTPPPENDKPRELPSRGASVRNGPKPMPPKLNIDRAREQGRYEKAISPEDARPRGPPRSNTGASSRSYSQSQRGGGSRRSPVQDDDAYPDDVYDMYSAGSSRSTQRPGGGPRRMQSQQRYYEDEEDDASDYDGASIDEGDFEMMNPRRGTASVAGSSRAQSRKPDIRKVRVKVHADDVRYVMVGTAVEFPDLVDRIRDKFGIRRRFKIKVRDEDSPQDMITMGDQDDLDMAMMTVKSQARKQKLDVGKLEVWLEELN